MGYFLPFDIYDRISKFLKGNLEFPFIEKSEILGIFFLFGKNIGIKTELDILYVKDIAQRTIAQLKREIFLAKNIVDSNVEIIKENYKRRVLQIYVELQKSPHYSQDTINKRIVRDPTILMSCYAQHISYFRQKCFFEIYDPFKKEQLNKKLYDLLLDRMVMISYNVEKPHDLSFNSLQPFIEWILKN